jgi:hypothetical protein
MTVLNEKIQEPARKNLQGASSVDARGQELTHSEDFARNGDYLGRQPADVSGTNHFDEEYFVDEHETDAEEQMAHAK